MRSIVYIRHILECIADVDRYIEGDVTLAVENPKTKDAVLRKLQIMAEPSQRLDETTKQTMPQIDWQKVSGFRNVFVHDYLSGTDDAVIIGVIQNRLPGLKSVLTHYLKEQGEL